MNQKHVVDGHAQQFTFGVLLTRLNPTEYGGGKPGQFISTNDGSALPSS